MTKSGNSAMPSSLVNATLLPAGKLKLPELPMTVSVISTPASGLPFDVVSMTAIGGLCGCLLSRIVFGGFENDTTDVNVTGPISLSPSTRPAPPPPNRVGIAAAYSGRGASQLAARFKPNAKLDVGLVMTRSSSKPLQKLICTGGRIVASVPCWCSARASGSVTLQAPALNADAKLEYTGSVLRSATVPFTA